MPPKKNMPKGQAPPKVTRTSSRPRASFTAARPAGARPSHWPDAVYASRDLGSRIPPALGGHGRLVDRGAKAGAARNPSVAAGQIAAAKPRILRPTTARVKSLAELASAKVSVVLGHGGINTVAKAKLHKAIGEGKGVGGAAAAAVRAKKGKNGK